MSTCHVFLVPVVVMLRGLTGHSAGIAGATSAYISRMPSAILLLAWRLSQPRAPIAPFQSSVSGAETRLLTVQDESLYSLICCLRLPKSGSAEKYVKPAMGNSTSFGLYCVGLKVILTVQDEGLIEPDLLPKIVSAKAKAKAGKAGNSGKKRSAASTAMQEDGEDVLQDYELSDDESDEE